MAVCRPITPLPRGGIMIGSVLRRRTDKCVGLACFRGQSVDWLDLVLTGALVLGILCIIWRYVLYAFFSLASIPRAFLSHLSDGHIVPLYVFYKSYFLNKRACGSKSLQFE